MTELQKEMIERGKNPKATPAGLSLLEKVDGFLVQQQWEALELVTCGCWEGQNKYNVYDKSGKVKLYFAKETTAFCTRMMCGEHRPFSIVIKDESGAKEQDMMKLNRGYAFCGWAVCPCCLHSVKAHYTVDASGKSISASADNVVAVVRTPWLGGCCWPTYHIEDKDGINRAKIVGPFCFVCDFCGSDFEIQDMEGNKMGTIDKIAVKNLRDVLVELSTDADNYRITFPESLPSEVKIGILAALFQIDYQFFEDDRSPREGKCCDIYCCGWPCSCLPRELVCCCCYASKKEREAAEKKKKQKGAPQRDEMER